MKKSHLWTGAGMVAAGILFLLAALLLDTPLDSLFAGFFGALTAPGVMQIWKYIKWTRPKNAAYYQERLEEEQIELRDERKMMLREKAGRLAYVLGLLVCAVSITVFSFLGELGIVDEAASRLVILFLGGYALFQLLAAEAAYRVLSRKY